MSNKKTVLFSVPSGLTAVNLLRGQVYENLRRKSPDLHIVMLTPLVHDPVFVAEFGSQNVELHDLVDHRPGWLEARLLRLFQESHLRRHPTRGRALRREEIRKMEGSRPIRALLRTVLSFLPPSFWSQLLNLLVLDPYYVDLFETAKPDLVLVSTPGINFAELPILRRAKQKGVPTMAVDTSWDNFTRLEPVSRVDQLVVWGGSMKEQAIELHGYPPETVLACGAPQFDIYADAKLRTTREQFCARIGADPKRRLLTLATSPQMFFTRYGAIAEILHDAIKRELFGMPAQLLIRPHPGDDASLYAKYEGAEHLMVDRPYRQSVEAIGGLAVDIRLADRLHLADTLFHSDVVITIGSTVTIEAAIFDRPTVVAMFDGYETLPYIQSVRRFVDYDHVRKVVDGKAVRLAWSPEELLDQVRYYLHHPEAEREGRRRVVAEQCGVIDGCSGKRVAAAILASLGQ